MSERVVVFLDHQNVYHGAREAFHAWGAPPQDGQIDPRKLGELITRDSPFERELVQVRVYRGEPDSTKDPKGYGACSRQVEAWRRDPLVVPVTRTLSYPWDWPKSKPREKGIDVALAVDFVVMAIRGAYDVGIIMSTDTDLKPALEAVIGLRSGLFPRCELAAWSAPTGHSRRLSVPGAKLWCHWIDEDGYRGVADPTDYTRSSP